ncbi:25549_t:CDS:2, partial [Gigaspora rosea]
MSIDPISNQFLDFLDAITLGQYDNREVKVSIGREKSNGWREVDNGLSSYLKILEVLEFIQVKFCLVPNINLDTSDSTQDGPNAFSILMANSKLPLLLQSFGWMNGLHETIRKSFVTHLASTLWYIDPHFITM